MSGSSKKVIFAALIGNTLVALTKFVAAAVTGSSAMLSEGIHSLNNSPSDTAKRSISGASLSRFWCLRWVLGYPFTRACSTCGTP
jgi:hypothetical protein